MNLLLLSSQATLQILSARDPRLEHVRGVLRLGPGDSFDVGAENGPRGRATILSANRESLEVTVKWGDHPPPPAPIDLLVALPRPATARKIIMDATTLGVRSIHFFTSGKSDPAYAHSRFWTAGGWEEARRLGAEQAFSTWLPRTILHGSMSAALGACNPEQQERWALDVYEGSQRMGNLPPQKAESVILAFGPERGWNATDRTALRAAQFTLCSMGERVLRLETAVAAGLALILARQGVL